MDSVSTLTRNPATAALDLIFAPPRANTQPPLHAGETPQLTVVIATLALGGAERIVLDWAASCAARYRVRLIVLRRVANEWAVPPGIILTRLEAGDALPALAKIGAEIAAAGNPRVLCHLLNAEERAALTRGGAEPMPVLHNAAIGWIEDAQALRNEQVVVTVSHAAAAELRAAGCRAAITVIHHLPATPHARDQAHTRARSQWRERWAVPPHACVIGMIGAVKPQKAYTHALRLLAQLLEQRDLWLVIIGGPIGRDGDVAWAAVLAQATRLQLEPRLRMPGFIPNAVACLPALDLLLNTSRYEGLSIATLEALAAGLSVVASAVGGQGEITAPGLKLIGGNDSDAAWIQAINTSLDTSPAAPAWRSFPSHRLWTLLHLVPQFEPKPGVLFITANLNAGGAQRSLCHLTRSLHRSMRLEVAVCGDSTADYFYAQLQAAGVTVNRCAATRDCFDHAEALLQRVVSGRYATVCFWNVDAKVKLLLAKTLITAQVRLIDVSPGGYSFEEMQALRDFQQWIAYDENAYYARLDRLVLKYHANPPAAVRLKATVIPNGVPTPALVGAEKRPLRIVVSGRIAPSKFVIEIIDSMRLLWQTHPAVELHLLGHCEPRHADYAGKFINAIGDDLNRRVFLHGAVFDAPDRLAHYPIALVLGEHQGSPNTVLEAMAAGVAVVANDSGGTRELVMHERTGLLIPDRNPSNIASALRRLLDDPALVQRLAIAGQRHVSKNFSMLQMAKAYRKLLT